MANFHWVVLPMVISVMLIRVNCQCVNSLTTGTVAGSSCDKYLLDSASQQMCGWIDGAAAQRACWDLGYGVSSGATKQRQFRCVPRTGNDLTPITAGTYTHVTGAQIGFGCATSAVNCFFGCYSGADVTIVTTGCSGATHHMAVACEPIDHCLDGSLRNCHGPFDADCEHVPACGPDTVCTNTEYASLSGDYAWTCECAEGYTFDAGTDPYDPDIGCYDIDECSPDYVYIPPGGSDDPPAPCVQAPGVINDIDVICQNTAGSFVCICDAGHWDDETYQCVVTECDEHELPTMADSNGWEGDMSGNIDDYEDRLTSTCDEGFEPHASDTISSTCRYDGTWCQCNSVDCKRKRCDVPHIDANAWTDPVKGVTLDTITYTCLDGYKANAGASYTLRCEGEGDWEDLSTRVTGSGETVPDRCKDEDECLSKDKCWEHSDCVNTIGSYHCICHYGYYGDKCENKISCDEIPEVEHADRITHIDADDGLYEMVVSFRCHEGYHVSTEISHYSEITHYKLLKEFDITCKVTKCWSPDPIPECVPISCGDPGIMKHASREGRSFYYGSDVTYTCYNGYRRSDYKTYNSGHYYGVGIIIHCEEKGWSSRAHCVDIDECQELDHPCGSGYGHLCVNTYGGYTCSCGAGYRLDSTGQRCVPLHDPDQPIEPPQDPCDVYHSYGLCNDGKCQYNGYGVPECVCDSGFIGAFCDRKDDFDFTIPYILSIVGIVVGCMVLVMAIVLACCVLTNHCNIGTPHHDDSAYYGHHPAKVHHKPYSHGHRHMFRSVMARGIPCME